ncbi:MAG TPA: alpha/beta hydrolase [Nocardioides sp.]|nr:alpha/beta hydrolase [Nocardioides sp.]
MSAGTAAEFEPVVGRYLSLEIAGRRHRLYVEEAGSGTPLLCLHTAGADSRQWRGVLNDPEITAHHRVIAFDLPRHGKSSPPEGWHEDGDYALTTDAYVEVILAVTRALKLDRPLVVGCSIGGRVVLHLALRHPDLFGGVIGLQSGAHVDPYYDLEWLDRPDVHGGMACAGIVSGLVGPSAPAADRWETLWHYMQGGPGVFKGDLYFYAGEGDIRDTVSAIDIDRCPVFLLSGEYDYSATPDDTHAVAEAIGTDEVQIMSGMGHFPMSEDPERFLGYFRPTLERARTTRDRN